MGWGDVSSDEESFNEDTPLEDLNDEDGDDDVHNIAKDMEQSSFEDNSNNNNNNNNNPPSDAPRTYDLPTGPPYTLFVGNLSYSIKDGRQLGESIGALVRNRMKKEITIVKGRIGGGRNQQNHNGYGYVEVGSLDEVRFHTIGCVCVCMYIYIYIYIYCFIVPCLDNVVSWRLVLPLLLSPPVLLN